jgi:membrane-associated HD superfamily phosphohydrolase
MFSKLKSAITGDMKIISSNYRPFIPVAILLLVIFILPAFFPVLSRSAYTYYGMHPDKYYTLISVTLVSLIPMLCGIAFGTSLYRKESLIGIEDSERSADGPGLSVFIRMFVVLFFSLLLIMLSILIIKPVPAQGWLRTIYAAILLSFQAPAGFLFPRIKDLKRTAGVALSGLYWLFLIALPIGLLLHHPWNRVACFSPFYWVAWAWMLKSPAGAVIYGSVAVILTSIVLLILLRLSSGRMPEKSI